MMRVSQMTDDASRLIPKRQLTVHYILFVVGAMVLSIFLSAMVLGETSHAALADNSRLRNGDAVTYCGGSLGVIGMVWLSNRADYYSETVAVGQHDTSVEVSIRGAANVCGQAYGYDARRYVGATNVRSESEALTIPSAPTFFWRGFFPLGRAYEWTTGENSSEPRGAQRLSANLDVSGVALCSASSNSGHSTGTVRVGISRSLYMIYGDDSDEVSGSGTEWIDIPVVRTCPTINWSLSASTSLGASSTIPGETIRWNHSIRNNGPSNISAGGDFVTGRYQNVNRAGTAAWDDGTRTQNTSGALRARPSAARNVCIDVPGGSTVNAFRLQIYGCNHTAAQEWILEPSGAAYQIRSANSGKCLDVPYAATANGSQLNQHDCNGTPAQQWVYNQATGQIFYRSTGTNICLDRPGSTTSNGSPIQIWTCNNTAAQQWLFDNSARTYDAGWGAGTNMPGTTGNQWIGQLNSGSSRNFTSSYVVRQSDVGNEVCRRAMAGRAAYGNYNWLYGNTVCVNIPYNYTLTPTIEGIVDGNDVEAGTGSIPVTGRVYNNGPTKSRTNVEWQITRVVYREGAAVPNGPVRTSVQATGPCSFFTATNRLGCDVLRTGTDADGYGASTGESYDTTSNVGDYPVGTKICFATSVRPHNATSTDWRHSLLVCLVVSKKPKVQVLGSDLIVGRGSANNAPPAAGSQVITSTSRTATGVFYGSWAEYGIVASGRVQGAASASGYSMSTGVASSNLCNNLSLLTFSNRTSLTASCNNDAMGSYTPASVSADIAARFPLGMLGAIVKAPGDTNWAVNTLYDAAYSASTATKVYTTVGSQITLTNTSSPIPPARTIVINAPNATVTIRNNITYAGLTLSSIADVPQMIIIARNIVISEDVTNIDAWLVATGTGASNGIVNTCGVVNGTSILPNQPVHANNCDKRLTVNGPVMANHLLLRRTAGAGPGNQAGVPAEVFNLRPDAYIWGVAQASAGSRVPTVSTKELPPRF